MQIFWPLLLSFWLLTPGAVCAATPNTISAFYDIYKLGIKIGEVEETFRRDNDRYTLISTTRAVGIFSLFKSGKLIVRSSGAIDNSGLRPLVFSADNENNKKDHKHGKFDWEAKTIYLTKYNEKLTLELPLITQDRLSAMYQFMFIPDLEQVTNLAFHTLNGSYLLPFQFDIAPGPILKTSAGEFNTLYLDNKSQGVRERTELWLATQHHNLMVKMIVTAPDGGKITQTLSTLVITP